MSNHVHLVFTLFENELGKLTQSLVQVVKSIKGYSAKIANQLLSRQGEFWSDRNYDWLVRDRNELHRIVQYVLQNPVKAGLCERWHDWTYTYIKPEYNDFD